MAKPAKRKAAASVSNEKPQQNARELEQQDVKDQESGLGASDGELTDLPQSEEELEEPAAKKFKGEKSEGRPLSTTETAHRELSNQGKKEKVRAEQNEPKNAAVQLSSDTPTLPLLPRVASWTHQWLSRNDPLSLRPASVVDFNLLYDKETRGRLRKLEVLTNFGHAQNLATSDPKAFAIYNNAICDRVSRKHVFFFALGSVAHSGLFKAPSTGTFGGRLLCVNFSNRIFPRMMAVIGEVFSEKVVFLRSLYGGVLLGTYSTPPKETGSGSGQYVRGTTPSSPAKQSPKAASKRPQQPLVLGFHDVVPAYDGMKPFDLRKVDHLPRLQEEIKTNSAVLVVFTVTRYAWDQKKYGKKKHLKTSISFNIHGVWLLADTADPDKLENLPPEQPFGVSPEPELELVDSDNETDEEEASQGEGNDSDENGDSEGSDSGAVMI